MKPVQHPPDAVLRAYADLLGQVFLYLRARSQAKALDRDEIHDLADALHNIGGLLADYGSWTDDEKYRRYYLRPFDAKWGSRGLHLEAFLESRLQGLSE